MLTHLFLLKLAELLFLELERVLYTLFCSPHVKAMLKVLMTEMTYKLFVEIGGTGLN
jgi:hypothetical protein